MKRLKIGSSAIYCFYYSKQQVKIRRDVCLFTTPKCHTAGVPSVDIYVEAVVEINKPVNKIIPLSEERKLICCCDGSYSHYMQIGHSGFRTSSGVDRICFLSPCDPEYGGIDIEVLATYLAIQYPLEKQYNILIIDTDNSKVEQLFKRPKEKDNINYPNICQILNEY